MEIVYLVIVLVVIAYFNRTIKKVLGMVEVGVDTVADMQHDELNQLRADQVIRHKEADIRRTSRLKDSENTESLSAIDIIRMRAENKL